ncbi:MAG: hypothetical protein KKG14_08290 [Alphaproteobacteria bacterium]|nr:hypothetical protein [Alphaproteobacteria bacterium]MBU2271009.1 hypothetical protein [Alphaproteobacteria bacterium]MBU2418688.1 hypothetical protein [Alphaproteobacteria bacterium]
MTAIQTLSALAAGALVLATAGAVQAQTPYTSYQSGQTGVPSSCRNVEQLANGYISAECQTAGGFRWSSIRTVDCRSGITNRDGVLSCTGARATVGPLYPDNSYGSDQGYGQTPVQEQPGGVFGVILGALFGGQTAQQDTVLDEDWSRGRRPLYQQRADLDTRIEAGVRDGSISRTEAGRLRADYDALVQLETRYAADGRMTTNERQDLRDRYRALSQRVDEGRDNDMSYGWRPLIDQRSAFDARVDAGVRSRALSSSEGARLRSDFQALIRLESDYMRDGLSAREQQDLTARLADLDRRVGAGGDYDGGYGVDPRAADIEARITAAERSGQIRRTEAGRLRDELRDLTRRWADLEARVNVHR